VVDRGAFIASVACGLLAAPPAAEAQVANKPVAGVLYQGAPFGSITISIGESLTQGLREAGYLEAFGQLEERGTSCRNLSVLSRGEQIRRSACLRG